MFNRSILGAACAITLAAGVAFPASQARAALVTFSGALDDPGNPALVGSGDWSAGKPAPDFTDDFAIANNVALHALTVATAGSVSIASSGFGAGGVDPYFTLFSGTGAGALFLASNYDQAFSTGGDFSLTLNLAAGSYTLALGAFANMSMAENWLGVATLTLGDGFTSLGGPDYLRDYRYQLDVRLPDGGQVPEPGAAWLALTALAGLGFSQARRRGQVAA